MSMLDLAEPPPPLKDHEKAKFGLGWEAHERGAALDTNPFPLNTFAYEQWREGWQARREAVLKRRMFANVSAAAI
jgi:hypothetical protein